MMPLVLTFPDIDPVAVAFGPVSIKWYGLAYLAGLLLGWTYIRRVLDTPRIWAPGLAPFEPAKVDDLLLYMTVGVVIGGRLGYVLLYEPGVYAAAPLQIFAVWKGGMSFHGALVGCGIASWLFARHNGVSILSTMDLSAAAVPLGLFFGRIANFVNGELWGRVTDASWGMVFCNDRIRQAFGICPAGDAPRYPSQLLQAALEGIALFLVIRIFTHILGGFRKPGLVTGIFLIGYGFARSAGELYREPHFMVGPLSAGQLYSIPMILLGLAMLWLTSRHIAATQRG